MSEQPDYIGRFPIIDTLGVGGMGVVYSGKDPDIGRKVAIKVLHATGDDLALERFKNEARTIGEISHPNIVTLLEYGIDDNKPFLVMEYLAGDALNQWIKKTHQLREHKSVLTDLCNALQYAHSKDILHRDLKPGNIQVLPTGQAKLLDFGIATSQESGVSQAPSGGLTATGFFIGTPKYLAPEILNDTTHTKTSDSYSLGLLAYTMLSGINPFAAVSFEATMTKILTKVPRSLHEINPAIPQELSDVIDRYLVKNPKDRPHSPDLLKLTLEKIIKPQDLSAKIVPNELSTDPTAQDPTVIVGKISNKSSSKMILALASTLLISAGGFFAYQKYIKVPVIPPKEVQVAQKSDKTKPEPLENADSNPVKKDNNEEEIKKEGEIKDHNSEVVEIEDDNLLKPEVNKEKPKENSVPKEEPVKVVTNKPKKNNPKVNKPVKIVSKPKPKIYQKPKVEKSKVEKPVIEITPKIEENPEQNVVTSNKPKPKNKPPVFQLPQFNEVARVKLKALSGTDVPRGKTKNLVIWVPEDYKYDEFKVLRGRKEFEQVKIRLIRRLEDSKLQITLYAEANTPMGNFSLVGIYKSKKTLPLNLEITL